MAQNWPISYFFFVFLGPNPGWGFCIFRKFSYWALYQVRIAILVCLHLFLIALYAPRRLIKGSEASPGPELTLERYVSWKISRRMPRWGVAKGSSVSWVAKFKGDKNSECKLSNERSRSYKVTKLLLPAGK